MKNRYWAAMSAAVLVKAVIVSTALSCFPARPAAASPVTVRFALGGTDIERDKYKTDLIKLILDSSGIDYSLYYHKEPATMPSRSKG